jgi:hypothetical protein
MPIQDFLRLTMSACLMSAHRSAVRPPHDWVKDVRDAASADPLPAFRSARIPAAQQDFASFLSPSSQANRLYAQRGTCFSGPLFPSQGIGTPVPFQILHRTRKRHAHESESAVKRTADQTLVPSIPFFARLTSWKSVRRTPAVLVSGSICLFAEMDIGCRCSVVRALHTDL